MPSEISCGTVLFRKTKDGIKFLLLHYAAGHWDFPKGNQENNEEEHQTAKRELSEETGIAEMDFIGDFKEEVTYFYRKNAEVINKKVAYFLAKTSKEKVTLSYEHIGYSWLGYENALKKLSYGNSKELLKKAQLFLEKNNLLG